MKMAFNHDEQGDHREKAGADREISRLGVQISTW